MHNNKTERPPTGGDKLRLMDHDFLCLVLRDNPPAAQEILRTILKKDDLVVTSVAVLQNPDSLSRGTPILEVTAHDGENNAHHIEILPGGEGATPIMVRRRLAFIADSRMKAGMHWMDWPETWLVFIVEDIPRFKGMPILHVESFVAQTKQRFNDGQHILYVNGSYSGDDTIGRLMADFRAENASEMHSELLAKNVSHYKETAEGQRLLNKLREHGGT